MPRRGRSSTIGKFAKLYQDRRASEIRMLGELLRRERAATAHGDRSRPGGERANPTSR
ncbi:hypothetical protein [Micromonospora sp. HM5-17]|jgi:hypothetical protein|uniref:hypothetical protein n=1 Tax=Micromonospora sp. HM5-17 TaxID=2487710 RepID=UPI00131596FA|nr:hypothetical protein [Micromonospora sp. HM5-17]